MEHQYANEIFDKIKDEKRERIINAAIVEFADLGLAGGNINTIAKNADVSVGSLYKYFDSKENLFFYIVTHTVNIMKGVLHGIIAQNLSFLDTINEILKAIIEQSKNHASGTRFYNIMTTEHKNDIVWKIAKDMEGATSELYVMMVKSAQEKGEIKNNLSPEYIAFFIDNLFMQLQFAYSCDYYKERLKLYISDDAFKDDERMRQELFNFISKAIQ